jgi:ketosteroid isomerase-like protein
MKYIAILSLSFLWSCTQSNQREKAIQEITQAEVDFAQMASDSGIAQAFLHFAAEDAVLLRSEKITKGPAAIKAYFDATTFTNIKLSWKADFVDAAESGELGYTYGKYAFSATDTSGEKISAEGIFHTVWRKQPEGQWRFVWD